MPVEIDYLRRTCSRGRTQCRGLLASARSSSATTKRRMGESRTKCATAGGARNRRAQPRAPAGHPGPATAKGSGFSLFRARREAAAGGAAPEPRERDHALGQLGPARARRSDELLGRLGSAGAPDPGAPRSSWRSGSWAGERVRARSNDPCRSLAGGCADRSSNTDFQSQRRPRASPRGAGNRLLVAEGRPVLPRRSPPTSCSRARSARTRHPHRFPRATCTATPCCPSTALWARPGSTPPIGLRFNSSRVPWRAGCLGGAEAR